MSFKEILGASLIDDEQAKKILDDVVEEYGDAVDGFSDLIYIDADDTEPLTTDDLQSAMEEMYKQHEKLVNEFFDLEQAIPTPDKHDSKSCPACQGNYIPASWFGKGKDNASPEAKAQIEQCEWNYKKINAQKAAQATSNTFNLLDALKHFPMTYEEIERLLPHIGVSIEKFREWKVHKERHAELMEKVGKLYSAMSDLRTGKTKCPEKGCPRASNRPGYTFTIASVITHLNDKHGWTRNDIADWLETLDADLTFPTPGEEVTDEYGKDTPGHGAGPADSEDAA